MLSADLHVTRGGFEARARFEAPSGEVTVLFGPSGSGKSTVLAGIAGLLPARGRCAVDDVIWQDDGAGMKLPTHRRRVGVVFQDGRLLAHHDVAAELAFVARRRGTADRIPEIVAACGLAALVSRPTPQLSGGERQRVALARALLADPAVLLLDEPLASLDGPARRQLLPLIERTARESRVPVVYVTHSLEELARLGDRVLPIEQGRVAGPQAVSEALAALSTGDAGQEPLSVLKATVVQGPDEDGLYQLRLGNQTVLVAGVPGEPGATVRLRVRARDVSVALDAPSRTSILNVFEAEVRSITEVMPAEAVLRLEVEGQPLLARVSRRSMRRLALAPGLSVYAQLKAIALT